MKSQVLKSTFWSAFERFSVQGITFLVQIVLARILMPEDYGLVGMLVVFLAISQTFIDSGFSTALIQKKSVDEKDFSTVFYFSVFISIVFYILLFFSSPYIANFYHQPLLSDILRVSGAVLFLNALTLVQRTILIINIDFKTQSKASFLSAIISGCLAIAFACLGFGVWSLVLQSLLSAFLNAVLLSYYTKWKPCLTFSFYRLKKMFSFGINILLSGLVYTLYAQIYILIIGRRFNADDLGYYTRADQFYNFPSSNICEILKRVYFPVLCRMQDEKERLIYTYRKSLQFSVLIIFPLMMCISALSVPIIRLVLTDKWISVGWMLQLLCFRGMLFPLSTLNLNILNVIGMSKVYLKVQLITHVIAIVIVGIIALWANIFILILCQIIIVYLMTIISSHYVKKYFKYGLWDMVKDVKWPYIISIVLGLCTYQIIQLVSIPSLQLIIGLLFYSVLFFAISWYYNICDIRTIKQHFIK